MQYDYEIWVIIRINVKKWKLNKYAITTKKCLFTTELIILNSAASTNDMEMILIIQVLKQKQ